MPRSSIRKLFEELSVRKYAAARSKTISQLEAGSEFTERCDAGGGAQVRRSLRIVRLRQTTQNHGKALIAVASAPIYTCYIASW